jgi:transposase
MAVRTFDLTPLWRSTVGFDRLFDLFALYCERNLIERFFNKIKHFRGIATRYDKLARNYLAAVQLVAAIVLLN